jgi:hypothetical protein
VCRPLLRPQDDVELVPRLEQSVPKVGEFLGLASAILTGASSVTFLSMTWFMPSTMVVRMSRPLVVDMGLLSRASNLTLNAAR